MRSLTAIAGGLVRELGELSIPQTIRRSQLYRNLVEATLRFLIEQVGQVKGVYPGEEELSEDFLVRRAAGNGIELIGILAFRASPVWVLAALADASGAGVPNAGLTLTNQDTVVVTMTATSDSSGNFTFPAVPAPGAYSISVQVGGFTRREQKDIAVTAGERRSVGTISLSVGNIKDSVTVQAEVTPVQTESAERSDLDRPVRDSGIHGDHRADHCAETEDDRNDESQDSDKT